MIKKANKVPMVKKDKPGIEDCGCTFLIDEHGVPIVECPNNAAQARAFEALQRNPDVSITVAAAIAPTVVEEVEEEEELDGDQVGFAEDDDFEDDFDDDDVALEEEEEDDLPF